MTNITITIPADFENEDDLLKFANIVQEAVNSLVKKFGKKKESKDEIGRW